MTDVTVLGERLLGSEAARAKMRRRDRRGPAGQARAHLLLHPMWVARTEVIADRPPFRPLVRPRMVFIDAVSEYRGLLEVAPPSHQHVVREGPDGRLVLVGTVSGRDQQEVVLPEARVGRERAEELVRDVQANQIDRSYALRKPRHQLVELSLVRLPLWSFDAGQGQGTVTINAVTGADESHLASRW